MWLGAAAKRTGVSPDEWLARRAVGEKWCSGHKRWEDETNFGRSSRRSDGLDNVCRESKNADDRRRRAERKRRERGEQTIDNPQPAVRTWLSR